MKILGQPLLGNVIGSSDTESLHGHILAPMAVMRITGTWACSLRIARTRCSPSIPSI